MLEISGNEILAFWLFSYIVNKMLDLKMQQKKVSWECHVTQSPHYYPQLRSAWRETVLPVCTLHAHLQLSTLLHVILKHQRVCDEKFSGEKFNINVIIWFQLINMRQ